jgi:hypothetical protein
VQGRLLIGLIIMSIVGAWLLWGAFKRGYYLGLSELEIREFLETVRRSPLGYSISPDLPFG